MFACVVLVRNLTPYSDWHKGGIVGNEASHGEIRFNRRLIAGGGMLIGIGGLLGCTGVLLLSSTVVSVTRRWVNQLDQPPSELAKLRWRQARAATAEGVKAWRSEPPSQSSSS
jgi:hypothetical protein